METILKLSFCVTLVVVVSCAQASVPSTCARTECPTYKMVEAGNGYEIRMYNAAVWMSTAPIPASSMTQATNTGFKRLFSYIQGDNKSKTRMSMTAPVVTQVTPGKSAYTVSFYIPKANQQNPPLADDLHVQKWNPTYVAVRQFGGWVSDDAAKKESAALMASLKGTKWIAPVEKTKGYLVAGYNAPFEIIGRVNEIMVPFNM
ncbi:unnamed protein product [Microthlaspi erraticum]|uniref:SOUL heme-binding protein n=1 Tax=Microthlaspi erraticum TaxID=1685480 RepID=A0A6D2J7L0_9BRAS|nr:unnamed protein product [Microthlaspi erraticum]